MKSLGLVTLYEIGVYNVYSNTDTAEGRGATIKIGCFDFNSDADIFAQGKGVAGSKAEVKLEMAKVIVPYDAYSENEDWNEAQVINGKLEPFKPADPKKKREEILNKLSQEERDFLGLK